MEVRRNDTPPTWSTPEDEERAGLFRETLTVAGRRFDLIARQPVGGRWAAWVHRASLVEGGPALERPLRLAGEPVASLAEFARGSTAAGSSAAEALATLADAIRAAVADAAPDGRTP